MTLATSVGVLSLAALLSVRSGSGSPLHSGQDASTTSQRGAVRTFDDLRRTLPQMSTPTALQIRIQWLTGDPVENPAHTVSRFDVVSIRRLQARIRAERSPQVSSTSLVVVVHDRSGQEVDWRVVADPRVVRSEGDTSPDLSGEVLYYLDTELRLLIPDVPGLTRLSVYKVRSERAIAVLDAVAAIDLPAYQ